MVNTSAPECFIGLTPSIKYRTYTSPGAECGRSTLDFIGSWYFPFINLPWLCSWPRYLL